MGQAPQQDTANDAGAPNSVAAPLRPIWMQAVMGVVMATIALAALAVLLRHL